MEVNPTARSLSAKATVMVSNLAETPLRSIWFSLDWNRPASGLEGDYSIEVLEVSQGKRTVGWCYGTRDRSCLEVILASPLRPREKTAITMVYTGAFPFDPKKPQILWPDCYFDWTFGRGLSMPYPRLLALGAAGWQTGAIRDYLAAEYTVTLSLPEAFTVVSSGKVTANEKVPGGSRNIRVHATEARGFGLLMDPRLEVVEGRERGVAVYSYFMPGDAARAERLLQYAKEVIRFYLQEVGFYPGTQLSIAPGFEDSTGGFATTNLMFVHAGKASENFMRWVVAHEIGHQYFGILVGDATEYPKWLTLGLGLWLDKQYSDTAIRDPAVQWSTCRACWAAAGMNTSMLQPVEHLQKADFDWNNAIAHGKSFLLMLSLEREIGRDAMWRVMRGLLREQRGAIVSQEAFRAVCEEEAGKSLQGFFDSWLRDEPTPATDLVVTSDGILRAALPKEEPEAYGRIAIYAGRLIDGTGADPTQHKVVVCEKDRIAEIVDAGTFRPAPATYIIDASAKTVLPGIIDMEVCLFGDGSGTPPTTREEWEARYRQNAQILLNSGVTTVRDVYGGISRVDCPAAGVSVDGLRLREAIHGHAAPRILATGPPIGARESTYFPLISISSPQEATDAVSRAVEEGANLIYFFASNIDLADNPANLSPDTMKALVAAAHERGLRITAESIGLEANRAAVAAGVDCLKHGVYLDDALVSEMRERGTYYVPTLAIFHHYLESAKGGQQRTKVQAIVRAAEDSLRRALKGGVRVVAGSDSGGKGCRHGTMLQEELQLLVATGMAPMEAIRSATAGAAECLGLSNEIGTIGVGKVADVLVVDQNPLSQLSTLLSPNLVIQGGKIAFRRSGETR